MTDANDKPRVDLREVAVICLHADAFVTQLAVRARFLSLPHNEFDPFSVTHLRDLGLATWNIGLA